MSRHSYHNILKDPALIAQTDINAFHAWVEQYPYVPLFRVLLAAKYQAEGHPDAPGYLEMASFYVQDRKQLKHLLRNWQQQLMACKAEAAVRTDDQPVTEETPQNTIASEPGETTINEELSSTATDLAEPESEALTETTSTHIAEDESTGEVPVSASQDLPADLSEEEEAAISALIYTENEPVVTPEEVPEPEELQLQEPEPEEKVDIEETACPEEPKAIAATVPDITAEQEAGISDTVADEGISEQDDIDFLRSIHKYEEPVQPVQTEDDWSPEEPVAILPENHQDALIDTGLVAEDISWLLPWIDEFSVSSITLTRPTQEPTAGAMVKTAEVPEPVTMEITQELTAPETSEETKPSATDTIQTDTSDATAQTAEPPLNAAHSFDEWLSIMAQRKKETGQTPVFDLPQPDVVKALEENTPPIIQQKDELQPAPKSKDSVEEGTVKQLAAESIAFKQDMATETLAKIYERQGKIDLAISIYEKLMLKFPEKSSYFAGRINRLK